MNTAAKEQPSSRLRISDADRDRAIAELSEHFQAGRLTADEFDDRTGRALQARTAADLAPLFADLPRKQQALTAATSRPASPAPLPSVRVPVVPIAILAVIALGGLLSGHPGLLVLVPLLVMFIVRRLVGRPCRRAPR
jgi:Domain of unknown function (DUF1707)